MSNNNIRVMSLSDGMGGIWIALKTMGIKIGKGYSSEINKFAIGQVSLNFPDIEHIGDMTKIDWQQYSGKIDLLSGGTPCTKLSIAGSRAGLVCNSLETYLELKADRESFDKILSENESILFWEFINALTIIQPKYFFLENVASMASFEKGVISKALGLEAARLNSSLVSAQNRDRLYWCNVKTYQYGLFGEMMTDIPQPVDRKIMLKDILQPEDEIDPKYILSDKMINYLQTRKDNFNSGKINIRNCKDKASCLNASSSSSSIDISDNFIELDEHSSDIGLKCVGAIDKNKKWLDNGKNLQRNFSQGERVYSTDGKSPTLNAQSGGTAGAGNTIIKIEEPVCAAMRGRYKVDGVGPDGKMLTAGLTQQELETRKDGKTNTLTTVQKDNMVVVPIEDDKILVPEATEKGYVEVGDGEGVDLRFLNSDTRRGRLMKDKCNCLTHDNQFAVVDSITVINKKSKVKSNQEKAACLTGGGHSGGNHSDMDILAIKTKKRLRLRRLTPLECCRLQTIPTWYKWNASDTQIYRMIGNGWTNDMVVHGLQPLVKEFGGQ